MHKHLWRGLSPSRNCLSRHSTGYLDPIEDRRTSDTWMGESGSISLISTRTTYTAESKKKSVFRITFFSSSAVHVKAGSQWPKPSYDSCGGTTLASEDDVNGVSNAEFDVSSRLTLEESFVTPFSTSLTFGAIFDLKISTAVLYCLFQGGEG